MIRGDRRDGMMGGLQASAAGKVFGNGLVSARVVGADAGPDGSGASRGGNDGRARRTHRGGGDETAAMA